MSVESAAARLRQERRGSAGAADGSLPGPDFEDAPGCEGLGAGCQCDDCCRAVDDVLAAASVRGVLLLPGTAEDQARLDALIERFVRSG